MTSLSPLQSVQTFENDVKRITSEEVLSQSITSEEPTIMLFLTGCKRTEFAFSPTTILSEVLTIALNHINLSGDPAEYCLVRVTQHNLPLPLTKSLADLSIESGTRLSCMVMNYLFLLIISTSSPINSTFCNLHHFR